jgi:hypothetical protein
MRLIVIIAVALIGLSALGTHFVRVQRICTTAISARTLSGQVKKTTCEWRIKHS